MTPDPSRQWYVYFNETELGPFSETDLVAKLKSKEFNETAFVYTDGMANWEAVSGVEVLKKAQAAPPTKPMTLPKAPAAPEPEPVEETPAETPGFLDTPAMDAPPAAPSFGEQNFSQDSEPAPETPSFSFETPSAPDVPDAFASAGTPEDPQKEPSLNSSPAWSSEEAAEPQAVNMEPVGGADAFESPGAGLPPETPAGEFTEEKLSGSRAGAFPEDEMRLENAPDPVASTKSGVQKPGRGRFYFRLALGVCVLFVVIWGAAKTPLGVYITPGLQSVSDIIGVDLLKIMGLKEPGETAAVKPPEKPAKPGAPTANPANPAVPGAPAAPGAAPIPPSEEKLWAELKSFKAADNGQALPVRIASQNLLGPRPIIVGVVSPMVVADRSLKKIRVAIFPDGDHNLMVKPRVWIKEVPLFDEYFSIGPLTLEGNPLPAGAYQIMFRGDDAFLGSQVFSIGTWPSEAELPAKMKELETQRTMAAAEERKELESRLSTAIMLAADLERSALEKGIQAGAVQRKAWLSFSMGWIKRYQDLVEQMRPQGNYRFYAEAHTGLENFVNSLKHAHAVTEIYSQKGAKAFVKAAQLSRYTDLWIPIKKNRDDLKAQIVDLEKQQVEAPKIDAAQVERIKKILMGD